MIRWLLWWVAAHGLSDAGEHGLRNAAYALALAPWPCERVLFGAASVAHLAQDFGVEGSVALHAVLAAAHVRGAPRALDAMLLSIGAWHVPRHLARVAQRTSPALALATAAAGVGAAARAPGRLPTHALLRPWARRVVVVHVALDAQKATRAWRRRTPRRRQNCPTPRRCTPVLRESP